MSMLQHGDFSICMNNYSWLWTAVIKSFCEFGFVEIYFILDP